MAKAGRKRKTGERFKSGRLKPVRDYGCDGYQRRAEKYGVRAPANDGEMILVDATQTHDAIGRAWSCDLLHYEGKDPMALRDAGRTMAALYWRALDIKRQRSTLERFVAGMGSIASSEDKDASIEAAFDHRLNAVNALGRNVRVAFDQLAIDENPDEGPDWLDRLIWHKQHGSAPRPQDTATLRLALMGLAALV